MAEGQAAHSGKARASSAPWTEGCCRLGKHGPRSWPEAGLAARAAQLYRAKCVPLLSLLANSCLPRQREGADVESLLPPRPGEDNSASGI